MTIVVALECLPSLTVLQTTGLPSRAPIDTLCCKLPSQTSRTEQHARFALPKHLPKTKCLGTSLEHTISRVDGVIPTSLASLLPGIIISSTTTVSSIVITTTISSIISSIIITDYDYS